MRQQEDLETPEDNHREAAVALVDAYLRELRPEGQVILENRWAAPSVIHRFTYAELATHLTGLLPETLDAFRAAARSPMDWSPLAGAVPRCRVMEEYDAASAYHEARVFVGPYESRPCKYELMLSTTPLGIGPDGGQALVYVQCAWLDGRVERYFVLVDRSWMGWRKSAEWRFG